jgi:uncharacterized YigZ family protein
MSDYWVPKAPIEVEEEIKGSRFITRVRNVDSVEKARAYLKQLREQEPTATHHCWAYIVGNPQSTTLIGCSDDGEPSGTAGKPMLNVLQHSGVGDVIAVCTRYYGGTKLGTGGLVRAYSGGVKLAMEQLQTEPKVEKVSLLITAPYEHGKDLEYELKQANAVIDAIDYSTNVTYTVTLPVAHQQQLMNQLTVRFGESIQWTSIA